MNRNPLRRFRALFEPEGTLVGTVSATYPDGSADVALVGGGAVRASNDGFTVGDAVFVRSRIIVGAAPSPNEILIEV